MLQDSLYSCKDATAIKSINMVPYFEVFPIIKGHSCTKLLLISLCHGILLNQIWSLICQYKVTLFHLRLLIWFAFKTNFCSPIFFEQFVCFSVYRRFSYASLFGGELSKKCG